MAKNIFIVLLILCASEILSQAGSHSIINSDASNEPSALFQSDKINCLTVPCGDKSHEIVEKSKNESQHKISSNLNFNNNKTYNNDMPYSSDLHEPRDPSKLLIFKRTISAGEFNDMRDKKDFEYFDYVAPRDDIDYDALNIQRAKRVLLQGLNRAFMYNSETPKRAPSGFIAMKGKKSIEKRVPTVGFYGVRGKKSYEDLNNIDDQLDNFSDVNYEYYAYPDWQSFSAKRAPNQGFFGMRGKRYFNHINDEIKRANQLGFIGMRGRRLFNYDSIDKDNSHSDQLIKRQPNNGFFGMRGKKDVSRVLQGYSNENDLIDKRAKLSQFFGTRGKKQPLNTGFFGMRGKKHPVEFRGKFVGVRGKKDFIQPDLLHGLEDKLNDVSSLDLSERGSSAYTGIHSNSQENQVQSAQFEE